LLKFSGYLQLKGLTPATVKIKFDARITYEDGTRQKLSVSFPTNGQVGVYTLVESDVLPITKAVSQVRIRIRNANPSGKLMVDLIEVFALSNPSINAVNAAPPAGAANTLLPLPPASDDATLGSR
jgi:hypothetical protein